jgi:hypothetical protein
VGSTHVDLQKNKLEIGLKYNKEEETRGEGAGAIQNIGKTTNCNELWHLRVRCVATSFVVESI